MNPDHESIRAAIDKAIIAAPYNLDKTQEYVSQWKNDNFNKQLARIRSNTDLQNTKNLVSAAREAYIHKAASAYREIDMAVEQMEQAIANCVYDHSEQEVKEAGNLPCGYPDNLQITIGTDIDDRPVVIDFNQVPHFVSLSTCDNPIYEDVCNAILAKPEVRCLSIGSDICEYPQSLFPPALSSIDQEACLNWIKAEYEQRRIFLKQNNKLQEGELGPVIFLFISIEGNKQLLDTDIIKAIASNGKYIGFHLVIDAGDGLSIRRPRYNSDPAINSTPAISLINKSPNDFYVSILEIDRASRQASSIYRLLLPGEFNIWITRFESSNDLNNTKMSSGLVPIYSDLGTQFALEGHTLKASLEERRQRKEIVAAQRRTLDRFRENRKSDNS